MKTTLRIILKKRKIRILFPFTKAMLTLLLPVTLLKVKTVLLPEVFRGQSPGVGPELKVWLG